MVFEGLQHKIWAFFLASFKWDRVSQLKCHRRGHDKHDKLAKVRADKKQWIVSTVCSELKNIHSLIKKYMRTWFQRLEMVCL